MTTSEAFSLSLSTTAHARKFQAVAETCIFRPIVISLRNRRKIVPKIFQEAAVQVSQVFAATAIALVALIPGSAHAGETIDEAGALACFTDKWDETEPDKGHKLVDYASRCVIIPDDPASPKVTESCVGKFEYMPDESWKGSGTCTDTYKSGDTKTISWNEGSDLKEYQYKVTGGTGKLQGATGSGTYMYENLTDKLAGGRQKGQVKLR